jgi:hypothetical protein
MKIVEVRTSVNTSSYFKTYSNLKLGDLVAISGRTGNAIKYRNKNFIGVVGRLLSKEEFNKLIKMRRKVR